MSSIIKYSRKPFAFIFLLLFLLGNVSAALVKEPNSTVSKKETSSSTQKGSKEISKGRGIEAILQVLKFDLSDCLLTGLLPAPFFCTKEQKITKTPVLVIGYFKKLFTNTIAVNAP